MTCDINNSNLNYFSIPQSISHLGSDLAKRWYVELVSLTVL